MDLPKYLRKQVIVSFVANLVINGALAWWLLNEHSALTAWGEHGYGPDLLLTGFLLSWLFSYINLVIHRKKRERGELPTDTGQNVLNWLPHQAWLASTYLGLAAVVVASLGLIGALQLMYQPHIDPLSYALIKGTWTGVLAAVLVVICIRASMRTPLPAQDQ